MTRLATYRLQLRSEFSFDAAAARVPYLARLGVSHVYCSPYLQAAEGSSHGYDVVDPRAISAELGGVAGRERLVAALQRYGLLQIVDIVPNHMAIRSGSNVWWWDVLENGPSSRYSSYFDVEWKTGEVDRVLLPILGDQYGVELEAGKIQLVREEHKFFVVYYEHKNPVAPRAIGHFLRSAAEHSANAELAFVAESLCGLPAPSSRDPERRRRRHRDKQVLEGLLARLVRNPEVARAIDEELARVNSVHDELDEILEKQNYRLAHWKIGNHDLDYRRFFDIDSLIGLRVEEEEVLEVTHQLIVEWLEEGSIDGLRIDHIDGLYDPHGYLEYLRGSAPAAWLLVEKILEGEEQLPAFPVEGTTGYDFLNVAQQVLLDPDGGVGLDKALERFVEMQEDYASLIDVAKKQVLREALGSDFARLVTKLGQLCHAHRRYRDFSRSDLASVLSAFFVAFPVYRTYLRPDGRASEEDLRIVTEVSSRVRMRLPQIDERLIEFVEQILTMRWRGPDEVDFVMRFQQLTGPVMAKGVEDTAFYRYLRLIALNEVGGDPSKFSMRDEEFHGWMEARQKRAPESLNTTSTHDTKRSEDVRARLLVLSEMSAEWAAVVETWSERMRALLPQGEGIDRPTEYFLWQNLLGAWPISEERMAEFLIKAVREMKLHTTWNAPDPAYEQRVLVFLTKVYESTALQGEITAFCARIAEAADANALHQVLLKLTCPGIPDIYQGTEIWDRSLVDPDNRRAVDYGRIETLLGSLEGRNAKELWADRESGGIKLFYLTRGLHVRARHAAAFGKEGEYRGLFAEGARASRILAYQRGSNVIVALARFIARYGRDYRETFLSLPPGTWRDELTEKRWQGRVNVGDLFSELPSVLLTLEGVA